MLRWVQTITMLLFVVLISVLSYEFLYSKSVADAYRERLDETQRRLESVSRDYEQLRSRYNEAVAKTAVTELIVADGKLCVNIRTAEGVDRAIATPFNPAREIYVDYVVLDGRLWIRRVFDQDTPPGKGLIIDPERADVDWNDPRLRYGNAVYRSLSDGRWIVTVTGDGSLGLVKTDEPVTPLSPAPAVGDYPQI